MSYCYFCFNAPPTTEIYPYRHSLSLHDALPICHQPGGAGPGAVFRERRDRRLLHRRMLAEAEIVVAAERDEIAPAAPRRASRPPHGFGEGAPQPDRKSTRLNSSH